MSRQRVSVGVTVPGRSQVGGASDARSRSGRRLVLARALVLVFALIVPLGLLEGALRLFGPILPGNYDTGHYLERHPVLGHLNVPSFDGWIKTSEFTTRVQISPLGLRDPRSSYARPPDLYRILLLGDSFVEGVQVNAADTVAARLEASLQQPGGKRVEVINAGVAGYGTGQEMLLYEHEGRKYDPQLVVLVVFLGNDIGDNTYRPDPHREAPTPRPSFELDSRTSIRVVPGKMPEQRHDVRQVLRDCCLLYNVFETGVLLKLSNGPVRDQPEQEVDARYLVRSLYEVDPDDETLRGWRITERLLGMIRDRAKGEGMPLVVVGAPDALALDETAWEERMGGARAASGRYAPDAPSRRFSEMAARVGVPFIDLYDIVLRESRNQTLYFPIDSHWTPAGHALVAREIEAKLRELGLAGR